MTDVITFVPDTAAFIAELQQRFPEYLVTAEDGTIFTPIHVVRAKNANGSLAICRLTDEQLAALNSATSIENFGWWDELEANATNLAKALSIYDWINPVTVLNDDGTTTELTRPKWGFA